MAENSPGSIGAHLAEVIRNLSELIRAEIRLIKSELKFSVQVGSLAVLAVLSAIFLFFLMIILVFITLAYFLTMTGMHPAWAFLIVVGIVILLIIGLLYLAYASAKKVRAPERTIKSVQGTAERFSKKHN